MRFNLLNCIRYQPFDMFRSLQCPLYTGLTYIILHYIDRGRRGRDHMVVLSTTTYVIRAYHLKFCEFESCSLRGVLDTTLCDKVCQ
jgi:hypothetical protein